METSNYSKHSNAFATINSNWDYIKKSIPAPVDGYWDMEAIVNAAISIFNFRNEKQIELDDQQLTSVNDYSIMIYDLLVERGISNEALLNAIRN